MRKKVEDYLDELNKAITDISDQELKQLVEKSALTDEQAKVYAHIETVLLDCFRYSGEIMTQTPVYTDSEDNYLAKAA